MSEQPEPQERRSPESIENRHKAHMATLEKVTSSKGSKSTTLWFSAATVGLPFLVASAGLFVGKVSEPGWLTLCQTLVPTGLITFGGKKVLDKFAGAMTLKAGK